MQRSSSSKNQADQQHLPAEQHLRAQLELLQDHDADASTPSDSHGSRGALSHSPPSRAANGFDELTAVSHEAVRALGKTQAEAHIHPDLRGASEHSPNMMSIGPAPGQSSTASPTGNANASIAPAPPSSVPEIGEASESRKAKRELSQSKRAAQNRAAQRAFRQRKEGYIKTLEQQVRDHTDLQQAVKALQAEIYTLREYTMHIQSKLIDATGECPPPPPNVNLSQTALHHPTVSPQQEPAPSSVGDGSSLDTVAQAVAGLAAQEQLAQSQQQPMQRYPSPFKTEQQEDESRTAEEIDRQFQQDDEQGGVGRPGGA